MFSVYGETGRLFKGEMEELRHVESIRAVRRIRAVDGELDRVASTFTHEPPQAGHRSLPSPQREHLAAYAQASSVRAPRHPLSRVADVMSRGLITVMAAMPVRQAWQMLAQQGLGQAPVVDAAGLLVGLLTRADLMRLERLPQPDVPALVWQSLLAQPVSSIMWTPVTAVGDGADIRHVARVLLDTHLPGLPVVDDAGMVTGFVSRTDILQAVVHDPPLDLWS
jgi:CBS-domain-containing membrane protein